MARKTAVKSGKSRISRQDTLQQLERIAQEWRAVFDSIPEFISIHDTDFNLVRLNRAMADAMKVNPADLVGQKCYKVFHDSEMCVTDCPHQRTLETGQSSRSDIYEPHLGMNLEVITSPIFDKDGKIVGTVHVARDVTWRKKAEEILREEKERYREIADMLPQIVFEIDTSLMITFANKQALEIAGYSPEDLKKGINALSLLVPEYRQQAVIDIMIAMGKKESQHFEFTLRRKDGTTFPASVFLNPVSRGGKVTGMAGIVINLSEQKKLEQLKDDFIGMVSHELRTPLTSIIGSVNMVRGAGSRLTARDVRQLLDDAASSAEDLSDTLTNLLELSRVKAERLILHPEMVNIKTILRSVVKKFRSRSADHRFVLSLPKGNIIIAADPLRLEHVLHNLLENAIKYSPRGGNINISLEQDKDEYVFGITDSGIGISAVDQQKLFTPFQRLEDIKTAGIGLGLLVCRRLVEAHHGRIWVDSKPGKGSTFYFTIPIKRS